VLLDHAKLHSEEATVLKDCPCASSIHALRGLDWIEHTRTGSGHTKHRVAAFGLKPTKTEIFFVTWGKSEEIFSPFTRYEDFASSPSRFPWQSAEHDWGATI